MSLSAEHSKEHDILERASRVLAVVVNRVRGGVNVPRDITDDAFGFFNNFALKHFKIEEKVLFPRLTELGAVDEGLAKITLLEHEKLRAKIKELEEAWERCERGEGDAKKELARAASELAKALERHRETEEVLVRRGETMLSPIEHSALLEEYARAKDEELGDEGDEEYEKLAARLEKLVGLRV